MDNQQSEMMPAEKPHVHKEYGKWEARMWHWISVTTFITLEFLRDTDFSATGEMTQHIPSDEGVVGFIDQHIGSSAEALEVYAASRGLLWMVSKASEIIADKKIPARVQVGTAALIGTILPSMAELGLIDGFNQVADPLDVFGPIVAGIFAYSSWEVTQRLFAQNKQTLPIEQSDQPF